MPTRMQYSSPCTSSSVESRHLVSSLRHILHLMRVLLIYKRLCTIKLVSVAKVLVCSRTISLGMWLSVGWQMECATEQVTHIILAYIYHFSTHLGCFIGLSSILKLCYPILEKKYMTSPVIIYFMNHRTHKAVCPLHTLDTACNGLQTIVIITVTDK